MYAINKGQETLIRCKYVILSKYFAQMRQFAEFKSLLNLNSLSGSYTS